MTARIVNWNPFTVEYSDSATGRSKQVVYSIALTKKEIQEKMQHVVLDDDDLSQEDLKNECELNALENQTPEC